MVIAADVGNTAIKLSALRCFRVAEQSQIRINHHSFPLRNGSWTTGVRRWVDRLRPSKSVSTQWRIASVNRVAGDDFCDHLAKVFPLDSVCCVTHKHVPIDVDVDEPSKLGIDRLLGAFAAKNRFEGPIAIVDAGSAVTVDWIDHRGFFMGGAILPGLHLQTQSLATGTDALPPVDWSRHRPITTPGRETNAAIRLGVLSSVAGAIDRLIDRYTDHELYRVTPKENHRVVRVVLTGGDASIISPHIEHPHIHRTHLVCRGLLDLDEGRFAVLNDAQH